MRSLNNNYKSKNHSKYLLQFHVILVCKYRLKLLEDESISSEIKRLSNEILQKHGCSIKYMEVDKDHIHYLIETSPTIRLSDVVMLLKSYTIYHIWRQFSFQLSQQLRKERTFWTDGYFISSIGQVSEMTLKTYIEIQGK